MGLDKSCMDKPYLIGRATALVESLMDVPSDFVAMVQVNPLQKLSYYLREALKKENEELMDIAANIGNIPSPFVDAKAQFYVGYYHQKSEIAKCEDRVRIGKRIAEIRQAKGLSIRQLAEASGVNFANIYKIENGKYNVSIDILGKICEGLDCRLEIIENTTDDNYISKNLMPKKGDVIIITKKRGVLGSIKVGNKYKVHDAWERDWRGKIVKTVIFYEVNSRGVKVRKGIRDVSYDWDIVE